MSGTDIPRKRSLAEWSYLIRREHVLRAVRHPVLTPAAKQVLVCLSVATDDPFVLPARPPVRALARRLALAERTVRQAITELVEQGCLSFRTTGEFFRPGEGAPSDPVARPDLAGEWAFLSDARDGPSLDEHLDMLARLRDHAAAAKRIATAVSAERALGRALAEQMRRAAPAEPTCRPEAPLAAPASGDEEAPLGPPDANLELVDKVNADRALAPAARHVLIEVMLDRANEPVDFPEDDRHRAWSQRIARRHGITVRGARKALAELEDLRLIAQANGDVCVYPDRVAERMRRGTGAPSRLPLCDGLDPVRTHLRRLERLRDLALEEGLVSTALAAQRAVGRALGYAGAKRVKMPAAPKPAMAPPAKPPQLTQADILPTLRDIIDSDPGATAMVFEILAEIEAETAAQPTFAPPADAAMACAM